MSQQERVRTTPAPVGLVPLDERNWRVVDPAYADGDRRQIVGYLADLGDGYEMLWMRPGPGVRSTFATLDAALEAALDRLRADRDG
ncbi:hypothetical protein [Agromyces indicus]|uniref:Uncharacterized protein n=1 Tax=Agromyces indicus TaxID=758919 RepID=A0ABU1FLP6_9MICO|nr:hypothetical protein [Agromyces indicus]MDR5692658.1 hypothetical protein [Agromyces indicus]